MTTIATALLSALKDYGAAEIFGIPGDFALPFFKVIEQSNVLPLYTLSHEPAVGFAADAASRYRSGLGVAAVTYGAGALNMVNPVAMAYAEKSPLVVISGAPGAGERDMGLGLHHQVKHFDSQLQVYEEVTCDQAVLDDPDTAPAAIARVLRRALERSRPVYIELPRDMVDVRCEPVPPPVTPTSEPEAARACAEKVMELLKAADQPALLLGVEVRRYGLEDKVEDLARRLGLPTAVTFMARGILAGGDTPLIGTYLGLAGEEDVRRAIERSDAWPSSASSCATPISARPSAISTCATPSTPLTARCGLRITSIRRSRSAPWSTPCLRSPNRSETPRRPRSPRPNGAWRPTVSRSCRPTSPRR